MSKLKKPPQIERNEFKSQKWDEITEGRNFEPSDVPTLILLCHWYAIIERCIDDLDMDGNLPTVAFSNGMDDIKAMPQISTMKQASAEIRALNKQLGIADGHDIESTPKNKKGTTLYVIQSNREKRLAKAKNSTRTA